MPKCMKNALNLEEGPPTLPHTRRIEYRYLGLLGHPDPNPDKIESWSLLGAQGVTPNSSHQIFTQVVTWRIARRAILSKARVSTWSVSSR